MERKIPRNVLVLAFVALASGFGQDLITPVLPGYLSLVGISAAGIGLVDGLLQGSTSVFRLVSGILSDRFQNRKRFVFLGYALSSVARPLLGLAGGFVPVAALRTLDGISLTRPGPCSGPWPPASCFFRCRRLSGRIGSSFSSRPSRERSRSR